MAAFPLTASGRSGRRPRRADAGRLRLAPPIQTKLRELFGSREPIRMAQIQREIATLCRRSGLRPPSRAALYRARQLLPLPPHRKAELPDEVRQSLYNLDDSSLVPGEQIVFYAFNHGSTAAMSFAAGLPQVYLERAVKMAGWRPKSRSLLQSVLLRRKA